ncbi:hypothetical protein [Halobacillus andaensis]|uniref:hypothetical protein n=1 Tax=Halobacillus andaensis TaxID=1176239 RepID=UPI003D715CBF
MERQQWLELQEIEKMKQRVEEYRFALETLKNRELLSDDNRSIKKFLQIEGAFIEMEEENQQPEQDHPYPDQLSFIVETVEQLKEKVHSMGKEIEQLQSHMKDMLDLQQEFMEENRNEKQAIKEEFKILKESLEPKPVQQETKTTQPASFRQLRNMVHSSREIYDTEASRPQQRPYFNQSANLPGNQSINKNTFTQGNIINSSRKNTSKKKIDPSSSITKRDLNK